MRRFASDLDPGHRHCPGCSDPWRRPSRAWKERKQTYLDDWTRFSISVLSGSARDEPHNVRSLLVAVRNDGEAAWARFKGGKEGNARGITGPALSAPKRCGVSPRLTHELEISLVRKLHRAVNSERPLSDVHSPDAYYCLPSLPIDLVLPQIARRARLVAQRRGLCSAGRGRRQRVFLPALPLRLHRGPVLAPHLLGADGGPRRPAGSACRTGTSLGEGVGYQVRVDQQTGPRNAIVLMTKRAFLVADARR